jgi:hypothetical protein
MKKIISKLKFILKYNRLINIDKLYRHTDESLKYIQILEAVNYLKVAGNNGKILPATYFEFGCHSGRTFSAAINASKYVNLDLFKAFAFDSFEGLPETNQELDGYFETGTFRTSKKEFLSIIKSKTGVELDENHIVQGFYENSLTEELQKNLPKIGVVHIDVDLYSSTIEVLNFISPLLVNGSIILFDDWYCFPPGILQGEKRAFHEFIEKNPHFKFEPWKAYSTFGQSFFVTGII